MKFFKLPELSIVILREKEKLVDFSLLIAVITTIPLLFSSVFRVTQVGWKAIFALHIILALITVVLYFMRKNFSFGTKVNAILLILFALFLLD